MTVPWAQEKNTIVPPLLSKFTPRASLLNPNECFTYMEQLQQSRALKAL